jgi:hypothetical protein
LSSCLPEIPTRAPIRSRTVLVLDPMEIFPRVMRLAAAARSRGSSARRIASISLGRKSLRATFSASSPRKISSRSTSVAGISSQPQLLTRGEPTPTGDQHPIRAHHDRMQQSYLRDTVRQARDVAQLAPAPRPDYKSGHSRFRNAAPCGLATGR